jgi:hypothetical protein
MQRLGLPDGALRIGIVHYNTGGEVDQLLGALTILRTSASGTPAALAMAVIDQPSAWAAQIAANHSRSARPSREVACAILLIASATVD